MMFTFDQLSPGAPTTLTGTLGGIMENNFADLIERLMKIQSGGKQRSPKLIAEDERLLECLHKKSITPVATPQQHSRG
jgi:hypothetical protein